MSLEDVENDSKLSYDVSFTSDLNLFYAFGSLNEDERQVVMLHVESGMKFRKIADFLSITSDAAQKRYQRTVKKLKAYYLKNEVNL